MFTKPVFENSPTDLQKIEEMVAKGFVSISRDLEIQTKGLETISTIQEIQTKPLFSVSSSLEVDTTGAESIFRILENASMAFLRAFSI